MLNYFPMWKNISIILILIVGLLYAFPNFYGEDPTIQITSIHHNILNKKTLYNVNHILKQQHILIKYITLHKNNILISFTNTDLQLKAHKVLMHIFGNKYIIALNLTPSVPNWLNIIGAKPIRLGLDLRGGLHFIIEVDHDFVAINKIYKQIINDITQELVENKIFYKKIYKLNPYNNEISFLNDITRNHAEYLLSSLHQEVTFSKVGNNRLSVSLKNDSIAKFRKHAVQQDIIILRNRLNQLGIIESLIQLQGSNHIIIEIPGIQNASKVKEIIETMSTLEFRLVNSSINPIQTFSTKIPEDSEVKITKNQQPIVVYKKVILSGEHIVNSVFRMNEYNQPQVNIFLDNVGGKIMSNFSKLNMGKFIAILFIEYQYNNHKNIKNHTLLSKKEKIISIARIQSLLGNNFYITGITNNKEAHQLSLLLRAGTLTAPIKIIDERIIGPTLGLQNIIQGLKACLWSIISSIIFMISWYRKFGVVADIALIANLILIIAIMSLLPGVTLTMPGIAGIVLTLAVAIDANVLINERIKDELNNGSSVQRAINTGYRLALPCIIDANITTLIIAIILYIIGIGSIQEFAITTIIGISTSMFTAIVVTRAIVNRIYGSKHIKKLSI